MKHLLLTTIAAVLLAGCGEAQESVPQAEAKPEPTTAKAPDISIHEAAFNGNINVDQAVGAKGSVYAEILPGQSGAVTIFIDERERRYEAVTNEPAGLKTGDLIEVKEVISGSLLKVTKLTT